MVEAIVRENIVVTTTIAILDERLWGENYFDPTTKKWTGKNTGSATCMCDFVQFCFEPIKQIINTFMNDQKDKMWPMFTVLLEMMIFHLPSPTMAQKYRVENLLGAHLMINMQLPSGMAILKLFAFVRMYADKVSSGLKVRIMGPNFFPGENKDLNVKNETVEEVLFGNTVGLVGLDPYITKNATVKNKKEVDAHPVKAMKFSCNVAYDLPKLVEGLKHLEKSDPMVVYTIEKFGKHTIAANDDFMGGAKIIKSDPVVSFTMTVLEKSCHTMTRKSSQQEQQVAIDDGRIVPRDDNKVSSKILSEEFSWEKDLAKKIWCFGLATTDPNMVVDMCKGCASKEGTLAEENMRGICFEVCDVALHTDAIHRVGGRVIPNARRVILASHIIAKPRLFEPVLGGIYRVLNQQCGHVCEEMQRPSTPLYNIMVYLPAFSRCVFDHWDMMFSDPLEAGPQAATLVTEIRKRKGLKEQMTPLYEFKDKL
ncbi:hypothetical protein UlMin_013989 [Ulmus minor]